MDIDADLLNLEQLLVNYSGYKWYLYSQNAAWLEPSRVNIYYGMWRRFNKSIGRDIFSLSKESFLIDPAKGLKSYGLAEIKIEEREFVASNLAGDFDNCLIISNSCLDKAFAIFDSKFKHIFSETDFFCKADKFGAVVSNLKQEDFVIVPDFSQEYQRFHVISGKEQ